jgi:hypothetical protein
MEVSLASEVLGLVDDDQATPFEIERPDTTVIVTDHRPVGDIPAPDAEELLGQGRWREGASAHDLTVAGHSVAPVGRNSVAPASAENTVGAESSDQAVVAAESVENIVTGTAVDEVRRRRSS